MAVLDDGRDAVRNAGLLLLVDLTSGANEDLGKIIAFEDVFAKVFALIRMEGGLAEAGITAQDCLSLLANLVRGSSSNQTMFRESGCVAQLAQLLQQAFPPADREAAFVAQGREKSTFGLLQLLRLFLVPGEASTSQNQTAFFRAGTAQILIDLGFETGVPLPIRTAALNCVAELIANNSPLQENFAALTVVTPADAIDTASSSSSQQQQVNGTRPHSNKSSARASAEKVRTYVIEALLDLTLDRPQEDTGLRYGACGLIQAYLVGHERIKAHFLQRAISGHTQGEEAANVLTTLTQPSSGDARDAMGVVFGSWIVQDLIAENPEAKAALAGVREGDENEGEDVLSFLQALGSELESALQPTIGSAGTAPAAADERVVGPYASVLTVFLWDCAQGVDDLLSEGSSLLQLLASAPKATSPDPLVAGLSVTLLGTIYEFSTKDSPIPRRTLAPLLTQKLGRRKYLDALSELRRQPAVRDFDLLDSESGEADALLLGRTFIDLFSLEFSRLRKAIDKDPGVEVLPPSAAEAGVDRDVLDDLRQQLQTAKDALARAQEEGLASGQRHEQEKMTKEKELQTATAEVDRLRRINQAMQQGHEGELEKLEAQYEGEKKGLVDEHQRNLANAQQETQNQVHEATREKDAAYAELGNTLRTEQSGHASTRQQLEALTTCHNDLTYREKSVSEQLSDLTQRHSKLERTHQELQSSATEYRSQLERLRQESDQTRVEFDRFVAQVENLQDELKAKDEELAAERAGFAELEKEIEASKTSAPSTTDTTGGDAAKLEQELTEARESENSAREELESMLLVMGDIEAKRDAYREKVKTLGGEVSEDDDDGEDEEEDEEEDNDVD